ncbi:MAG TPA: DM13 domain-containing protein [Acidimicrobiales bacterium]
METTRGPRRRRLWWLAAMVAVPVVLVVALWFQPQKLFIDETVDDADPTASDGSRTTGSSEPSGAVTTEPGAPAARPVLATGELVSLDHGTSGVVRILDVDGRRVVRLEGLDTDNGPDLYLYLTTNPAGGDEGAFDDDFVNLGRLKGNRGDQNYDLAADVDLSRYRSVVIWCDRFNSAFGAADLASA